MSSLQPARPQRVHPTSSYSVLLARVREEGLLRRRRGYYLGLTALLGAALVATLVCTVVVGRGWVQVVFAVPLGLILTHFAFVAHEAAHRQIFESGPANDRFALLVGTLVVGMSYSKWMSDHARHHGKPNTVGRDPAVAKGVVSFTAEDAAEAGRGRVWFTHHQGHFFFPLLLLEGANLNISGIWFLISGPKNARRWLELSLLLVRIPLYWAFVFTQMSAGVGVVFIVLQVAVFGLSIGSSFAPNHVGMPVLPHDSALDFFTRQVSTARNIRGGRLMTAWMGGLDFQIEHHLFPSMPRPNLRRANTMVREFCAESGVPMVETTLPNAWKIIVVHMNEVGLAAGSREFRCPVAAQLGR